MEKTLQSVNQRYAISRHCRGVVKHDVGVVTGKRIIKISSIWAWGYAAPFNTVLKENDFSGKKLYCLILIGGNNGKTFDKFSEQLNGAKVIATQDFFGNTIDENKNKIIQWAKSIQR